MSKTYYFLKLNPPRNTFPIDITDEEVEVMKEHDAYWKKWQDNGVCLVNGSVFDPNGSYGVGIVEAEDEKFVQELIDNDPVTIASVGMYEFFPMRAMLPGK